MGSILALANFWPWLSRVAGDFIRQIVVKTILNKSDMVLEPIELRLRMDLS